MTQNIQSTGTCLSILSQTDIVLDCNGYNITYNTAGGTGSYGILVDNSPNTEIVNCGIFSNAASGSSSSALYADSTNDSVFHNLTINITRATGFGVWLSNVNNTRLENSTIRTNSSSIQVQNGTANSFINFNTLNVTNFGASINQFNSVNMTVIGNYMYTLSSTALNGVSNSRYLNNTISTDGSAVAVSMGGDDILFS